MYLGKFNRKKEGINIMSDNIYYVKLICHCERSEAIFIESKKLLRFARNDIKRRFHESRFMSSLVFSATKTLAGK